MSSCSLPRLPSSFFQFHIFSPSTPPQELWKWQTLAAPKTKIKVMNTGKRNGKLGECRSMSVCVIWKFKDNEVVPHTVWWWWFRQTRQTTELFFFFFFVLQLASLTHVCFLSAYSVLVSFQLKNWADLKPAHDFLTQFGTRPPAWESSYFYTWELSFSPSPSLSLLSVCPSLWLSGWLQAQVALQAQYSSETPDIFTPFQIPHFNLISTFQSHEQLCVFESAGRKRDGARRDGNINTDSANQSRQTLDGTVASLCCAVVSHLDMWLRINRHVKWQKYTCCITWMTQSISVFGCVGVPVLIKHILIGYWESQKCTVGHVKLRQHVYTSVEHFINSV